MNTFSLHYPPESGFTTTEIMFFSGAPRLQDVFFSADFCKTERLFVTDTHIAALPALKEFISVFKEEHITLPEAPNAPARVAIYQNAVLLILGPGEPYKTMQSVLHIVQTALHYNFTRESSFIAIGGGVICDMTAFAASIFKRGIKVHFVPTTLLAMVDAAIGGKSGCDFEGYKNMVGSFWPASTLSVWSNFVLSLPSCEYMSGLGEAIKTALLFSKELYSIFETQKDNVLSRNTAVLEKIIAECVKAKALIVQEDFRERGRRAFLNLGHTFGHALETTAGLGRITHGGAVCWGICRALEVSANLGLCSKTYAQGVQNMLAAYEYDTQALPSVLKNQAGNTQDALLSAMHKDKKNLTATDVRLILQRDLCDTVIERVRDDAILAVLA